MLQPVISPAAGRLTFTIVLAEVGVSTILDSTAAFPQSTELEHGDAVRQPGQRAPELTRRAILDAATVEFANRGFAGASVNEIAAHANVNKRMLYHYFGKKDDLYIAVLERAYAHLRASQTRLDLSGMSPRQAVECVIVFTWDYFVAHPEVLRLFSGENLLSAKHLKRSNSIPNMHRQLIVTLNDALLRGVEEGVFRHGVDVLHLYLSIASLVYFYLASRELLSAVFEKDLSRADVMAERLRQIVEVITGGLRP